MATLFQTMRHPADRRRELNIGAVMERENLLSAEDEKFEGNEFPENKSSEAESRGGVTRSSDESSVMGLERRGYLS